VSLRDFASIALDAGMGARNTEFRLIKDSDVYLDERWIRLTPIPGGKRVGPRWDRLQDAPKPIPNSYWLPISKEIAWIIEKWLDQKPTLARYRHSPYLCPPQTGVATSLRDAPPISLKGTNDLLRAAVRRSDVEVNWADARDHIVWHSLRHWYVTTLENATAGSDGRSRLQDIIDALRGDSVRTKRSANTYRHFTPDQLRDFIDRYFPTLGLKAIYEGSVRRVSETTHISDVIRGRARYGRGGVTY
jgi:integrase